MHKKGHIPWNKGKGDYISGNKNPAWKNGLYANKEWLTKAYSTKSMKQIAFECKCGIRTIARWLKTHNISSRKIGSKIKDIKGKNNHNWNGGKPKCIACGKQLSNYNAKYCKKHFAKKGKESHMYKGMVNIKQLVRSYVQNVWRPKIFERDRYVCQQCKAINNGNLTAHHKKRLSLIVDKIISEYQKDLSSPEHRLELFSLIISNPEINDLNNGITLCEKCHNKMHKGKRKDYYEVFDLYFYWGTIVSVYDADTITALLDIGFNFSYKIKLRLWGINTPEIKTKDDRERKFGEEARKFVEQLVLNKWLRIKTYKSEKYGRYLADVYLEDDTLLNELLIEKGFAREYFGEKRDGWFKDDVR